MPLQKLPLGNLHLTLFEHYLSQALIRADALPLAAPIDVEIDAVRSLFLEDTHRVSPFSHLVWCYSVVSANSLSWPIRWRSRRPFMDYLDSDTAQNLLPTFLLCKLVLELLSLTDPCGTTSLRD